VGKSGIRLRLLAALLSLVNALDVDYRIFGLEHLKAFEISPEARLHWWLHYYTRKVDIDEGCIKLHYVVPSAKYEKPVKILVSTSAFVTHKAVIDILWKNGIKTMWVPASVSHSGEVESMPKSLFESMCKKARIEALRISSGWTTFLGEAESTTLMKISPFYFTGVRSPLTFNWLVDDKAVEYKVSVFSSPTSIHDTFAKTSEIWSVTGKQPPVLYSGGALKPGHRYSWRLESVSGQVKTLLTEGVFWITNEQDLDEYVQRVCANEADEDIRAIVIGAAYARAGLYEAAINQYQSILERNENSEKKEGLVVYQAHIALTEIYTRMVRGLDTLNSLWLHVSEPLANRAICHATQIKHLSEL
jgi:hypothetical protein